MKNKYQAFYILAGAMVVLIAGVALAYQGMRGPTASEGTYDALAQCIADSGATFYGAFWCTHCQAQKRAFGSSEEFLPYVECSTPDGRGQTEVCATAGIQSYPTWEFADGRRVSGNIALTSLAEITECSFPEAEDEDATTPIDVVDVLEETSPAVEETPTEASASEE